MSNPGRDLKFSDFDGTLSSFYRFHSPHNQGLRHADENGGGDGDQAVAKPGFSSEGNPYKKPKTQRIWPTIFLKIPRTLKNGGTRPPPSPPPPPVAEPLPQLVL